MGTRKTPAKRKGRTRRAKHRVTTSQVLAALRARYSEREWMFLPAVADGVGGGCHRTADALAMNTWPSRGLELHGFELKLTRGDWLREMKNPAKAEEVCQFCDRWWLVVAEKNLVKPGELPPTWGLLVMRGKHLACETPAPLLKAEPWDRFFVASLLRRATAGERTAEAHRTARDEAYNSGVEAQKRREGNEIKVARDRRARLQRTVDEFEKASGLTLSSWDAGDTGEAVKVILEMRGHAADRRVKDLRRSAEDIRGHARGIDQLANLLETSRAGDSTQQEGS